MLTVVTITFNNFEELVQTVNSVAGLPLEHIVINGGTCEKTRDYLNSQFKGIAVSESDQGISDAFNKGIARATGEGVLFLNSGDRLTDPGYLAWAEQKLKENDFTYSDIYYEDPLAGKIVLRPHHLPLGRGMPFPHQSMIVKRSVFQELGGFKIPYKRAMCFEFTCRMIKAKKRGAYYDKPTALMAGGGISSAQEALTILESKRALQENQMFDLKNQIFYWDRKFLYWGRLALSGLGLEGLLKRLKRAKNHL